MSAPGKKQQQQQYPYSSSYSTGFDQTRAPNNQFQQAQTQNFSPQSTNPYAQQYTRPQFNAAIPSYPSSSTSPSQPVSANDGLQFYQSNYAMPMRQSPNITPSYGVMTNQPVSWVAGFGTGGIQDEPPLLEELEINLSHIRGKTFSVLNPFRTIDKHIMDDTDLMGPLLFCLLFGISLLLSGKLHFGYIYGVALMGWLSIWGILNLMSENGIDTLRAASVLGYCLLPMVFLSCLSIIIPLQGLLGLIFGSATVLWCTTTSSNMFVTVLSMKDQRLLVAYPVGLFYFCFVLMTIF